jgi:hypothetical protein
MIWNKVPELLGLIGSLLLAAPSIKHTYSQWVYKKFYDAPAVRSETLAFDKEVEKQMKRRALQAYWWNPWDSLIIFSGALCLAVSFALSMLR